ncbi:MAG: hypothetical protein Q7R94_00530 [bacterium]|nr:hypothetical protein [bacterium]
MTQPKTWIAGVVFIAILLVGNLSAKAAENETTCGLDKDKFEELKTIQNSTKLSYLEQIKQELRIRRELLRATTNCATDEARTLYANLNGINTSDQDIKRLQTKLSGQLDNGINYYELQKSKIDDLGLNGSRIFARDLADWREGNYKPTARTAQSLIIWSRNQDILQAAQKRFDQLNRAVNLLKIVDSDEIQNIWEEARNNFRVANDDNQKAAALLRATENPDTTLSAIHSSLAALSKTYQKFFELNEVLSEVLPSH